MLDIVEKKYVSTEDGSQPGLSEPAPVQIIHQIYGLYRDGKPMPRLFQNSQSSWQALAQEMGALYHLWSADEVDALIKQHYSTFWGMYTRAPFPVMRADIARICILHKYGGMYADMDVVPNAKCFAQVPLAVQKTYTTGYNTAKKKANSLKKTLGLLQSPFD